MSTQQNGSEAVTPSPERLGSLMAHDLMKRGGKWLCAARSWMQWHKHNGSDVTWGSQQELRPAMTVKDVEELAAHVAAEVMNEYGITPNTVDKAR